MVGCATQADYAEAARLAADSSRCCMTGSNFHRATEATRHCSYCAYQSKPAVVARIEPASWSAQVFGRCTNEGISHATAAAAAEVIETAWQRTWRCLGCTAWTAPMTEKKSC